MSPRYDIRALSLGGSIVGPPALMRFYVLHCIFIPIVVSILMILHFFFHEPVGYLQDVTLAREATMGQESTR